MSKVVDLLGDKTSYYLDHTCKTIDKSLIYIPSPDTIDKVWIDSDRNIKVLNSLQTLLGMDAWQIRVMCPFFLSIRILSIQPAHPLHRIPFISIRRIL